jgi:hypothetical protein
MHHLREDLHLHVRFVSDKGDTWKEVTRKRFKQQGHVPSPHQEILELHFRILELFVFPCKAVSSFLRTPHQEILAK